MAVVILMDYQNGKMITHRYHLAKYKFARPISINNFVSANTIIGQYQSGLTILRMAKPAYHTPELNRNQIMSILKKIFIDQYGNIISLPIASAFGY